MAPGGAVEEGLNAEDPAKGNSYATWYPPHAASKGISAGDAPGDGDGGNGLRVNNSLVPDTTVPFFPRQGNKVLWYTCGPTVYDVAHMGHARAYLTFDILRRIMEDYFNYEVVYQMNITDIDDKIIARARRTELLKRFTERSTQKNGLPVDQIGEKVLEAARSVLERELAKLDEQKAAFDNIRSKGSSKDAAGAETAVKEQELKVSQATEAVQRAEGAIEAVKGKDASAADIEAVIDSARDALSEALDKEEGHMIGGSRTEDHAIFKSHATHFESLFHEDMEALGVRPPTVLTRVSEYVPQVVSFIKGIQDKGFAYESNGSVYFDTHSFIRAGYDYRKLDPMPSASWESINGGIDAGEQNGDDGEEGSALQEKKSPIDFALWKKSKSGEPSWESPWGLGRPGWHIECSAMASDVLGRNVDIHAGGEDLRFPHHDNEMAQSEAFCGCAQWVNYFLHAGHLHIRGLKMSKSLKNFVTIRQALEDHTAPQIRLLFLLQNWDKPMLYSDQMVADAKTKESMLRNFFGTVKSLLRSFPPTKYGEIPQNWNEDEINLDKELQACQTKVHTSLCDNFDTPSAMGAIFNLVSSANKYINHQGRTHPRVMLLQSIALYITKILRTFGMLDNTDDVGFKSEMGAAGMSKEETIQGYLDAFVHFRDEIRMFARTNKVSELLDLCDNVRDDKLIDLGVRVEDRNLTDGQGSIWKLEDPEVLKKELEEKRRKQAEAAAQKRKNKIVVLTKELAKWEGIASVPPEKLFASNEAYVKYDESGIPTELASGEPISKKLSKNLAKEMDKHKKLYTQLQEKQDGPKAFLESLRSEIEALQIDP